jgi:hypothetical protein
MHNKASEWGRNLRGFIDVDTERIVVPRVGGKACCWPWYEEFHVISTNMRDEYAPRTAHCPPTRR